MRLVWDGFSKPPPVGPFIITQMFSSLKKHLRRFRSKVSQSSHQGSLSQVFLNTGTGGNLQTGFRQMLVAGCIFCLESSRMGGSFQSTGSSAVIFEKAQRWILGWKGRLRLLICWCWMVVLQNYFNLCRKFGMETTNGFTLLFDAFFFFVPESILASFVLVTRG